MFRRRAQQGMTLVETLLYLLILGLLIFTVANLLLVMVRSFYAGQLERELVQSATGSLERLMREMRKAQDVDATAENVFGVHPGRVVLLTTDQDGASTTIAFFLDGPTLMIQEGEGQASPLTGALVRVDNLVFRLMNSPVSVGIKIDLTLSASRGGVSRSGKFYSTAVFRGGYY